MTNNESGGGDNHPDQPERHENGRPEPPRVYVASLADYNAGRLHGVWLNADADPETLAQGVQAMLARSAEPIAEEWALHDYEGFGPVRLSEHESLETISRIGRGIAEHGPAFAHWAALRGPGESDLLERFADAYLGEWGSVEEFAESIIESNGHYDLLDQVIPESIRAYVDIDVAGFARDLELNGDITTSHDGGRVHVYDGHA